MQFEDSIRRTVESGDDESLRELVTWCFVSDEHPHARGLVLQCLKRLSRDRLRFSRRLSSTLLGIAQQTQVPRVRTAALNLEVERTIFSGNDVALCTILDRFARGENWHVAVQALGVLEQAAEADSQSVQPFRASLERMTKTFCALAIRKRANRLLVPLLVDARDGTALLRFLQRLSRGRNVDLVRCSMDTLERQLERDPDASGFVRTAIGGFSKREERPFLPLRRRCDALIGRNEAA